MQGMKINGFDMRPKNLKAFIWGSVFLLVFLGLLFLETRGLFAGADLAMTVFLQKYLSRSLDIPLSIFTLLGSFEVTSLGVLALGYIIFRKEKTISYSLVFFGAILVFEFIGKLFVFHPSPPHVFLRYDLPFNLLSAEVQTKYSFPSGHISRTFYFVVFAAFLVDRYLRKVNLKIFLWFILALLAVIMIVSRVYLGEHWASDVLGGIFLGSSMGLFTLIYYQPKKQ